MDCDSEFENDYFIDEEVSKSDTEADEDIDEYQTTVPERLILLLKKRRVSLRMSLLLMLQRSKKKSTMVILWRS